MEIFLSYMEKEKSFKRKKEKALADDVKIVVK